MFSHAFDEFKAERGDNRENSDDRWHLICKALDSVAGELGLMHPKVTHQWGFRASSNTALTFRCVVLDRPFEIFVNDLFGYIYLFRIHDGAPGDSRFPEEYRLETTEIREEDYVHGEFIKRTQTLEEQLVAWLRLRCTVDNPDYPRLPPPPPPSSWLSSCHIM